MGRAYENLRVFRFFIPVVMLAMALAGCITATETAHAPDKPDTGQWKFDRVKDPITGTSATSAWVQRITPRYPDSLGAGLELLCHKEAPIIRFTFSRKVGSKTADVAYRFDEKEGRTVKARFLAKQRIVVLDDDSEVKHFVRDLTESESLALRITSLDTDRTIIRFNVRGAQSAIEEAFANCPLPQEKRKRVAGG